MKYARILFLAIGFCSIVMKAQFKSGNVELSLTGSAGSWNSSTSRSGQTYEESRNYCILSIIPAIFLEDGFSLEPEFNLNAVEKGKPSQAFLLGLSYTYYKDAMMVAPFVRIGYGYSNSGATPFLPIVMNRVSDKFNTGILNAGTGIKILLNTSAIIRVELNYREYQWEREFPSYVAISTPPYYSAGISTTKNKYSHIGVMIGAAVEL